MKYALWCLATNGWVIEDNNQVVTYNSVAAAKRDLKENFIHQGYEIKEYKE
tara:strand:+ start:83 stop:235 length:153 start_codon:yes stop_codon:yes gene_type:complete